MITSKEAKLAWANGEDLEYSLDKSNDWLNLTKSNTLEVFERNDFKFRLKPSTITINGVEVPAPFEPEIGEFYYCVSAFDACGYTQYRKEDNYGYGYDQFGAWRTEEEIKQVVEALRQIFK